VKASDGTTCLFKVMPRQSSYVARLHCADPEEFLNSLLTQTLKADPYLELSSGQTAHLYQLFVERLVRGALIMYSIGNARSKPNMLFYRDPSRTQPPTVQELFEQSLRTSKVTLKAVPPVLILQMPR
jgi:ubiquitin thioesterase CYLD